MEHMWDTTWYEDLFFFATFFAAIFALIMLVYGVVVSVFAAMNQYSTEAIAVYWGSIVVALIIGALFGVFVGIMFWIWSAIPAAFFMIRLESNRKSKLNRHG